MEIDIGLDTADHEFHQGAAHAGNGLFAVGCVDNDLGEQRIIIGRNGIALINGAVDADAGAAGNQQAGDRAGTGPEAMRRILGIDAAFD